MISGKRISAVVNGVLLTGHQAFEVTGEADRLDGQTGQDNGFRKNEPGSVGATLVLEFVQDTRSGYYVELSESTRLEEVKVYRDYTDAQPCFYAPVAYVFRSTLAARVKERITHRVEIENYGQYSYTNPGSG